ncbi:MAG: hypothetical protein ACOC1F_11240 [Myxococcota bacterium]
MNQITATRPWEPDTIDLASTDEVPQIRDWILDDVATGTAEANGAPDTIPSPPPDPEEDSARMTIPAPPPVGSIGQDDEP